MKQWSDAILDNAAYDKLRSADGRIWERHFKFPSIAEATAERDSLKKKVGMMMRKY